MMRDLTVDQHIRSCEGKRLSLAMKKYSRLNPKLCL